LPFSVSLTSGWPAPQRCIVGLAEAGGGRGRNWGCACCPSSFRPPPIRRVDRRRGHAGRPWPRRSGRWVVVSLTPRECGPISHPDWRPSPTSPALVAACHLCRAFSTLGPMCSWGGTGGAEASTTPRAKACAGCSLLPLSRRPGAPGLIRRHLPDAGFGHIRALWPLLARATTSPPTGAATLPRGDARGPARAFPPLELYFVHLSRGLDGAVLCLALLRAGPGRRPLGPPAEDFRLSTDLLDHGRPRLPPYLAGSCGRRCFCHRSAPTLIRGPTSSGPFPSYLARC